MPSIGIYSYELYHFFGVERIIRVGTIGAMQPDIPPYDIIVGASASTNSNFLSQYNLPGTFAPTASWPLLNAVTTVAAERAIPIHVGNILSSDTFYSADETATARWAGMGVLGVEMESAALYATAAYAGKQALGIFTVADNVVTGAITTPQERQTAFTQMIELALAVALTPIS